MRTVSLFTILLLCLLIILVDTLAFYWLQSITELIVSTPLRTGIHVLFWVFTIGLVAAIIVLKVRIEYLDPTKRHLYISSFYGLAVSSFFPKLIFVVIISLLYALNFMFSKSESLMVVPLVGLFSGVIPFLIIILGVFRTLYRFKIHAHRLVLKDLPQPYDGLRLVQISDLHLGSLNYRYEILERAVKLINDLKPDIICFTGDLVNNFAWELRGWDSVLKKLEANLGKYAVLGNHDYGDYSEWSSDEAKEYNLERIEAFYRAIGFELLNNEARVLENSTQKIAVIGVENWGHPPFKQYGNLKKALTEVNEISFKILLTHNPSHWSVEVMEQSNIALTLSGHTHGMQAGVQYKNLKWSPIKYKYKHWAGLYCQNDQYLYVNRGLGWLGLPARIGMRPEITLLELRTA